MKLYQLFLIAALIHGRPPVTENRRWKSAALFMVVSLVSLIVEAA